MFIKGGSEDDLLVVTTEGLVSVRQLLEKSGFSLCPVPINEVGILECDGRMKGPEFIGVPLSASHNAQFDDLLADIAPSNRRYVWDADKQAFFSTDPNLASLQISAHERPSWRLRRWAARWLQSLTQWVRPSTLQIR